jgi:hypothetical protein
VVDSENIKRIKYTPSEKLLIVQFSNDAFYQYNNVDPLLFQKLITSNSVGSFFATSIKNFPERYPCHKLDIDKLDDEN